MNNLIFLYEENGFTVSKLNVLGLKYFIVENKATDQRYIRKSPAAVDAIIHSTKKVSGREGR